jgi:ASC-1-like (ASCH) protein
MKEMREIHVGSPWFDYICAGRKRFEGRRNYHPYAVGERLRIAHADKRGRAVDARIAGLHFYPSFNAALRALPLEQVLPDVASVEEGVKIYQEYVSLDTQARDGVVMIEIEIDGGAE